MCGIIAGISSENIVPLLISGLKKLEYRGYDSAGIGILLKQSIYCVKTLGKVNVLENILATMKLESNIGIAHTRWATHGVPSTINAHPHSTERVAVVHNGIIENYQSLKTELESLGYNFISETDTEVVANLLDYYLSLGGTSIVAANQTIARLQGAFSLVFMFKSEQLLFATANKTPLILGLAANSMFIASDVIAFGSATDNIIYIEDGDKVTLTLDSYTIFDKGDNVVARALNKSAHLKDSTKEDYPHFMLKEIYEQPKVLTESLATYLKDPTLLDINIDWSKIENIKILACGTAYYSGLVGKYWLEEYTGITVDLEIASEYRYRKSAKIKNGVTIIISQSGETLDTLEALRKAKLDGQTIISIVNTEQSTIARLSDHVLPIMVGVEIGVASTKACLGQLMVLAMLSLDIAVKTHTISAENFRAFIDLLRSVPKLITEVLNKQDNIKAVALEIISSTNMLFIGRASLYPIALEGALKMKELSYIHAEAYAGGELKHGPMSLIDKNMPVVVLMQHNSLFDKMFSNMQEVAARGGKILAIAAASDIDKVKSHSMWTISLPECNEFLAPMIYAIPMQLLAYHTACAKGNDIDQPRNLAKSVTVE